MSNIEKREADIGAAPPKDENKRIVEGYAAIFDQPTVLYTIDGTDYKEVIDHRAFDDCDMSDVVFAYNHRENGTILARTTNDTLKLEVDETGLKVTADLADVTLGRDLYTLIRRGDVSKMSFAFIVKKDSYDRQEHMRRILKFERIVDVSAVDFPAYDDTSISARSYADMQHEAEDAQEREKLIIRTML